MEKIAPGGPRHPNGEWGLTSRLDKDEATWDKPLLSIGVLHRLASTCWSKIPTGNKDENVCILVIRINKKINMKLKEVLYGKRTEKGNFHYQKIA
jgi:hypothetical protein